jgi:hypothetical protein
MITVNCSQCKAALEMDDAFAGGVCRCHYCGTIQAVPANARRVAAAPAVPPRGNGAAPHAPAAPRGDGLDALADAVASTGLSRGALRAAPTAVPVAQPVDYARPPKKSSLLLPLLIVLAVVLLLMGIAGFFFVARTVTTTARVVTPAPLPVPTPVPGPAPSPGVVTPPPAGDSGGGPGEAPPVVAPKSPHFCGIDLSGAASVVYVLDRGNSTAELFDTLKEATYRSLESLKPGTKFQIIFWDNVDAPAAYPADGMAPVSKQEIEAARSAFADLIASGRATANTALQRAAKSEPAAIVLVTGKAYEMDDSLVQTVQESVKGGTKVHTVALKSDDGDTVLKQVADKTHGQFRVVTGKELRDYSY